VARLLRLLLPYRKLELTTRLSPADIVAALEREARAPTWSRVFGAANIGLDGRVLKFYGNWDDTGFDLRRAVVGRSSFTPRIHGTITSASSGSTVQLTMAPTWLSWVFVALWSTGLREHLGSF